MSNLPSWDEMIDGDCPLCDKSGDVDDYSFKIADLSISTLYLERDQIYPGYSVLIFNKRHVTGIEHLTTDESALYTQDLKRAADALFKAFNPDHMNYASLGNVIPHLHTHIIPRYKDDPRWRAPVWLTKAEDMQHLRLDNDAAYIALADKIREALNV